ncbi:hypothetical protein ACRRTK_011692 [Alexandromys fortis]
MRVDIEGLSPENRLDTLPFRMLCHPESKASSFEQTERFAIPRAKLHLRE